MSKTTINAKIVAHSLSPQGDELISVLAVFPRIILAEVNTHRMLSKNTSSSRAVPFNKMVEAVQNDPFIPIAWQKDHKGMQGNEYFTDELSIQFAKSNWLSTRDNVIKGAISLHSTDNGYDSVTKQLCNRLLEPFMWTTMLITGSREGWDNFFKLRCPSYEVVENKVFKSRKDAFKGMGDYDYHCPKTDLQWLSINKGQAEIHMMALAECIWDAVNESNPNQLDEGEWHIPFVQNINLIELAKLYPNAEDFEEVCIKISTAMAARTSYTVVGDEKEVNYTKMIELHDRLINQVPSHSSPLEHCAKAMNDEEYASFIKGKIKYSETKENFELSEDSCGWCNNFKGFIQYRYIIDNNNISSI